VETTMHQPSFRGVVAALSRKAPELGLGAAVFGARRQPSECLNERQGRCQLVAV
jgi:hypothetical protein